MNSFVPQGQDVSGRVHASAGAYPRAAQEGGVYPDVPHLHVGGGPVRPHRAHHHQGRVPVGRVPYLSRFIRNFFLIKGTVS